MKKLMALFIMFALMFTAGALAENADTYIGTWNLSTVQQGKMIYPANSVGIGMTVVLEEDGSAAMTLTGSNTLEGTWLASGISLNIVTGEENQSFAYDPVEDTLTTENNGMTMVFSRLYGNSPAKADAVMNDFTGMWKCHAVEANGMQLRPFVLSMDIAVTITREETACLVLSLQDSGNELLSWQAVNGAITEGVLEVTMKDDDGAFETLALTLDETGVLYFEMNTGDAPLGFYLTNYIYMTTEE